MSVVGQDHVRRIVLKESLSGEHLDTVELLDLMVRFCLDSGRDVVLEGILYADLYGTMLTRLLADHVGHNHVYYLSAPFEETVRRHRLSPDTANWTSDDMRQWWHDEDLLGLPDEIVLDADAPAAQALSRITADLDAEGSR